MSRTPTEPGIGLGHDHDKHCQRCLVELSSVRQDVDAEKGYGKNIEARVRALEKSKAKAEVLAKLATLFATGSAAPWVIKLLGHVGG